MFCKYKIGDVTPISVDVGDTVPDNRWNPIKTENSVVMETNAGHVAKGDTTEYSIAVTKADYATIKSYWENHTAIDWQDEDGIITTPVYLIVTGEKKIKQFYGEFYQLKISIGGI